MDPTYDQTPESGYKCFCCGARRRHLTTLCPENEDPLSLNQQRIRAGINTSRQVRETSIGSDQYHLSYSKSRKREWETFTDLGATYIHDDRRALMRFDEDHHMNPDRRTLLARSDDYRPSSQSDVKLGSNRGSHYSPPPAKRTKRTKSQRMLEHGRERGQRWLSAMPRGSRDRSPSSGSQDKDLTELLPQAAAHRSETNGRLSYWDNDYSDVKMAEHTSSRRNWPAASELWRSDGIESPDSTETVVRLSCPNADAQWISDMASFDVEIFFDELNAFMENRAVASDSGEMQVESNSSPGDIEEDGGWALSKSNASQAHRAHKDIGTEINEGCRPHVGNSALELEMDVDINEDQ